MNGVLYETMRKILGDNWITKVGGLVSGIGGLIILLPKTVEIDPGWGGFLSAAGGVIVGLGAKDYNVHSTETQVIQATVEKKIEEQKIEDKKL